MDKLAAALIAFQAECPSVAFDSKNPHYKSRYASLAAIHRVVTPILVKHGLAVMQFPINRDGMVGVETHVIHTSGEAISQGFVIPLAKNDPQGACSAVTYARRYGLSGALGIVTEEDDDGEAAQGRAAAVAKPNRQPEPRAPKPASPMSNVNKTKLAYAARERIKELGDDSIGPVEIIRHVAKDLGYASEIELKDDDFGDALSKVQTFEPGGSE